MIRRVGLVVAAFIAAGIFSSMAAAPSFAQPDKPPPPSGDPRATSFSGNATVCKDANLPGDIVKVGFTIDPTNTFLTITSVPDGIELTGTVVKGSDGYNVYPGNVRNLLHAPLASSGKPAQISHWFSCGRKTTSTEQPPPPPPGEEPPGEQPPGEQPPSEQPSTPVETSSPAAQGSAGAVSGEELANTGFSATVPLIVGGAMILLGAGLLYLLRRRARAQRP